MVFNLIIFLTYLRSVHDSMRTGRFAEVWKFQRYNERKHKEFDSHTLAPEKYQSMCFPESRIKFKGGRKLCVLSWSWAEGKGGMSPWWRNYKQLGCRAVWCNIFAQVFKHAWSRIVGDTKLDAFGFPCCYFKNIFFEIILHLEQCKNETACPKHKNVLTILCIFKISSKWNIFPSSPPHHLPSVTSTQKHLSKALSREGGRESLRASGSKRQWHVMHNLWHCLGSIKYSYLCNFVLYNPHSFIFSWLTGNDTNYAVGREAWSDSFDDFVNSGVFDCKLFPSRTPPS